MDVALRGSSPCATTAAILLTTRARQLGMRVNVTLVGDPDDITVVKGPAVVWSPVLASCGIGRELGTGATVVVRGAPGSPLMASLHPNGTGGWFLVGRDGAGQHEATRAFMRMSNDPRVPARKLAKDLRRAMEALGMSAEPAVLDLLFAAPAPPLTRLALALRAGRALSGGRGEPVTRYLTATPSDHDPLSPQFDVDDLAAALQDGGLAWILDHVSTAVRDRGEEWLDSARALAAEDANRDLVLVHAIAEVASHLVQLPPNSILPPLSADEDGVATTLKAGLAADGDECANAQLRSMFLFLGGKYATEAEHVFSVDSEPPPEGALARWKWFCEQAVKGRQRADELWPQITDPPQ